MKELNIKRFAGGIFDDDPEPITPARVSNNPRVEINSDLKIKGTNRDLKGIDTTLTEITNKINENIYCSVYMTGTTQNFSAGSYSTINLGTVEVDTHNGFNTSTHAYTVPKSGYYIINTQIEFNFSGSRRIVSRIVLNGSNIRYGISGGVGFSSAVPLVEIRHLNQGDVITIQAKVDDVDSTINASNISAFMQIKNI